MRIYRPVPPTFIPRPKKEEQALAPLQSTAPIQTRPILPQNLTPESSTSAPKIVFYKDKEGPGLHSLESEYQPNYASRTVGLVPSEFEENEFYMKNGDIVITKKHLIVLVIAKKRGKKGAKLTLKKIYMNTNNETTKRPLVKIPISHCIK
jgi:hypothetical protein